jgi:hypothetical protein
LLLLGYATAQAPQVPQPFHGAAGIPLQFVEVTPQPTPPDYIAIKRSNDERVAAENAAKAVEAARAAEVARQAELSKRMTQTASVQATAISISEQTAKSFIYDNESGNDPTKYNSTGCVGLGQACPGSKLLAICPRLDYACEDSFFTNYMMTRYQTWAIAYNFWVRTDCRPYCGHWW